MPRCGTAVAWLSLYGGGGPRLWYGRGTVDGGHRGGWRVRLLALTSFVGRAGAIREIAGLLEGYRLVRTEPGGAGKTRLAGGVAAAVAGRFADGGGWRSWRRWLTRLR